MLEFLLIAGIHTFFLTYFFTLKLINHEHQMYILFENRRIFWNGFVSISLVPIPNSVYEESEFFFHLKYIYEKDIFSINEILNQMT